MVVCAEPIVLFFGGEEYLGAVPVLMLSAPVVFLSGINGLLSQYLVAEGKERWYAATSMVGLVVVAVATLVLIPHFGIIGAICSSIMYEASCFLMRGWPVRKTLWQLIRRSHVGRIAVLGVVAFAMTYMVVRSVSMTPVLVQMVCAGLALVSCYGLGLLLLRKRLLAPVD